MGTFETIGNYVTKSTDLFSNTTIVNTYMGQLKPVALIILTLFMLWRTIQIMSGSNQKPVNDTLIELLVWSIVWSLAFNVGGWLQEIQTMMNHVYEWVGGGKGFFKDLDTWADMLGDISDNIAKKDSNWLTGTSIKAAISVLIIATAMVIMVLPSLLIVTISYFIIQILVAIAPFMILSYIFPSIKQLFVNWIELFLTNVLILLLISLFKGALLQKILSYLGRVESDAAGSVITNSNMITSSVNILLMTLFFSTLILVSVPLAKALSGSFKNIYNTNKASI